MKEKEKKTVACVVLGVSLVSLITLLVSAFADSLIDLIRGYGEQTKIVGGLTLVGILLGIAFVAVFFVNKKNRLVVNFGLAVAVVAYSVITILALYASDHGSNSYLVTSLTLSLSTVLTFAAWWYLTRVQKEEESATAEAEADVHKE